MSNTIKHRVCRSMISLLFFALAVFLCGTLQSHAVSVTEGDFTIDRSYSSGSYTVAIKSYNGRGGEITLPTTATINDNVYNITNIASNAFKDNVSITSVTIPEGYTVIETSAFAGCTALKTVSFPTMLTNIYASAFSGCSELNNVVFASAASGSLSIKNGAFKDCTSLTSINLPKNLSSISDNFARGCTALAEISVEEGNTAFVVSNGSLYSIGDSGAVLSIYPMGKTDTSYTIPSAISGKNVISVGPFAFEGNTKLTNITVPATVTKLDRFAFDSMTGITKLTLLMETAPTLGSSVCTNWPDGSVIEVQNDTVAAAFEPGSYTAYYTAEKTTVNTAGSQDSNVSEAKLSINAVSAEDGYVSYDLYLENAVNVTVLGIEMVFDSAKVQQGVITKAEGIFSYVTDSWSADSNGVLTMKSVLGITGEEGYSTDQKVKIATVTLPVKDGVKGTITAEIKTAGCSAIGNEGTPLTGTVTFEGEKTADFFIADYDVYNDGVVDLKDIAQAQRYYQMKENDADWAAKAVKADVNNDKIVDIQDFIEIFKNLEKF